MNEELYSLAQSIADITTSEVDLNTGTLYWYNPVPGIFGGTSGRETKQMPVDAFFQYFHPDDRERMRETLWSAWRSGHPFKTQYRLLMADGSVRWREVYGTLRRDAQGNPQRLLGVAIDITAYKEIEAQLDYLAHRDALTGLANRAFFYDYLQRAMHRVRRSGARLALYFIDLDRFKAINDTLGHACGDLLLQEVAARLQACVRKADFVARLGGDEFAILMEGHGSQSELGQVAEKILELLSAPVVLDCGALLVNASIGIACQSSLSAAATDAETLVHQADLAMYRAKEQRGNYHFYTAELEQSLMERKRLENGLRQAIESDALLLHFQPQIELATGAVLSAEALVRWPATGRLLLPAQFLVMAKETGLLVAMDDWVLKAACQHLDAWRAAGHVPLPVAINVSMHQLVQARFMERILFLLDEMGLPAHWLRIELTEGTLLEDTQRIVGVLHALRKAGLGVDIDNFGSGYFSLLHLRNLPVDRLKIDSTFVRGIGHNARDEAILRAVVTMSKHLQIRTLAEGVETPAQRAFLLDIGCDEMQGFQLSEALPADDFARCFLVPRQASPA